MINTLREWILFELNKIEGVAEVYDSVPKKLNWFPSIYFTFDRIESSVSDSTHNDRIYYFQINLFQEITTLGYRESELKICELLNDIIDRFDNSDLW